MNSSSRGRPRERGVVWLAIGLTWLVMVLLVLMGAWRLRQQIRQQIVGRDGEILLALANQYQREVADEGEGDRPWEVIVAIGQLDGILGAALYTLDGEPLGTLPAHIRPWSLPGGALGMLREGRPVSEFRPEFRVSEILPEADEAAGGRLALVEVYVPLSPAGSDVPAAVAGFLFDGSAVAREYAHLDGRLGRDVAVALGGAFTVSGFAVGWAFRRLRRAHALLAQRGAELQRANQELSRTARTAALGAVTAHLMHSLKSPVSGLQSFVQSRADGNGPGCEVWSEALAATRRMQVLIQQVMGVLRDHGSDVDYEVPLRELGEAVVARARPAAEAAGVRLVVTGDPPCPLDNRSAGLLGLSLSNLVENAVQATPAGGTVTLRLGGADPIVCEVADEGAGVPEAVRARLFEPQASTKSGGSGLGLAITRQLAQALGGSIRLASSTPGGSSFRIEIPRAGTVQAPECPVPHGAAHVP